MFFHRHLKVFLRLLMFFHRHLAVFPRLPKPFAMTFLLHGALGFLKICRWFRPLRHGLGLLE
jgi:hypothetical protein